MAEEEEDGDAGGRGGYRIPGVWFDTLRRKTLGRLTTTGWIPARNEDWIPAEDAGMTEGRGGLRLGAGG